MMHETALDRFWQLLGWVLALNSGAFEQIHTLRHGSIVALIVVLAAALSQVGAQGVVLFINRVKPVRFVFSLLIGAVLFAFGYIFLVFSTWLISFAPFTVRVPFGVVARTLGFSYAPLIFSLFGAMPYLGEPILLLLSLWHLLAMVVGFAAASNTSLWQAFGTVALGWVTLWVLQRTIGQPIAEFGHWVACQVAGVELVTQRQQLLAILHTRLLRPFATNLATVSLPETRNAVTSPRWEAEEIAGYGEQPNASLDGRSPIPAAISSSNAAIAYQTDTTKNRRFWLSTIAGELLGIMILASVTFAALVLLSPIRHWWFAWYGNLGGIFKLIFDLAWIGIIALAAAALLAPLEALGWWAGWYGDLLDATPDSKEELPSTPQQKVRRYVIYLDGIGQSTFDYLPDIQEFLDSLAPVLPEDVQLIKGIMPYSVRNNPLTGNRPLGFLWRLADRFRLKNPASLFGYLVNIHNVLVVAVSADKRYGPIYNLGIAQVMYKALIRHGYQPDSGVPITLVGFSGGGQMAAAAAPLLRQALTAPIEVISLGGVISGNIDVLKPEHLYHLVGDKDMVERMSVMFPGRWPIFFLSYWNRAKRMGKVNLISLGPVGHQLPGGLMDPKRFLPDGRSYLQQTIDWVVSILLGTAKLDAQLTKRKLSNYERYRQAAFNLPEFYPIHQAVSQEYYRPIAEWMGRLILPPKDQRQTIKGVLFEVHHAPCDFQHLVGQVVTLRLSDEPQVRSYVQAVTKDVHFSAAAEHSSRQGNVHPTRINHWRLVNPLESLAGSHPHNDVMVMLPEPIVVQPKGNDQANTPQSVLLQLSKSAHGESGSPKPYILYISHDPVQVTGRYYTLVKFVQPTKPGSDLFRVVHFNRASKQFDGAEEIIRMPQVIANRNDTYPSSSKNIEKSPLNETGWYIYGAPDESGLFIVQALAPRALLQLEPERMVVGKKPVKKYLKKESWGNLAAQKGKISTSLLSSKTIQVRSATAWREGKRALLIHVYGGIGGNKTEPKAKTPLYFGHFAYGIAKVVREPLTDELRFDIVYHQIYTHNTDGLIAGSLHWSRYMGDRQFGWLGLRPVSDTLLELDGFTDDYETDDGQKRSPLDEVIYQLEIMAARYRIGDGTGGTFVGPANNCTQDANQALYAALTQIARAIRSHPKVEEWKKQHPEQLQKLEQLERLGLDLKRLLLPWGTARADWQNHAEVLGSTLEDEPVQNLIRSLLSWRTILPRLTSDEVTQAFLKEGGSAWVLRTNQVGGFDPDIEPVAPMTL